MVRIPRLTLLTLLVGLTSLAIGIATYIYIGSSWNTYHGPYVDTGEGRPLDTQRGRIFILPIKHRYIRLGLSLAINALVTACTEVTGYVHGTTLKWALARKGRLRFNANLRLFTAAGSILSVNGHLSNMLFTLSLLLSYVASSAVIGKYQVYLSLADYNTTQPIYFSTNATNYNSTQPVLYPTYVAASDVLEVSFVGPLVLGVTLSIQAILALVSFSFTPVPTWSSSPLDVASSALDLDLIRHVPGQCMRSISEWEPTSTGPILPTTFCMDVSLSGPTCSVAQLGACCRRA